MFINKVIGYNKISNNISFTSDGKQSFPRSQQQNNINFEKELLLAQKADSVNANPITSLGYKLYKTFRFLSEHDTRQQALDITA